VSQNVYPTSDVQNNWNPDPAYAEIDEGATPIDSDFAYTDDNPTPGTGNSGWLEVHIGDPTDPEVSTGHVVRWRHVLIDGGALATTDGTGCDLDVSLVQGTTVIASKINIALDGIYSWTADSFTLSAGEADAIGTDYSDLRIRFDADGGGGSPASRRGAGVSWAELEVPDAPSTDRQAVVTAFELEVPTAPRKAIVTAFEFEIPNADRKAVVTAFEFEVPTAPRQAIVTAFELEVPTAPRKAIVTAFELETEVAGRQAIVTAFELETEDAPVGDRQAIITAFELETEDAPRQAVVTAFELETETAPAFRLVASDYIAAGGEDTTGQLTPPASGSFGGGRIQDDENPGDTVDLDTDEYREDEWCIRATSAAEDAATYQFRVLLGGAATTSASVDPRWTIGAGAAARQAIVTAFEFEIPNADRKAVVTAFELETEDAARQALVTAFELETEDAARQALVTAFEFEVPTAPRKAIVTAFEFETEDAARQALVTAFELETEVAGRQGVVTAFEFEIPNADRRALVTAFELETPDTPGRQAVVTAFELEVPDAPRQAIVTAFELETGNAGRQAVVTAFEFEIPNADRRAIITAFELRVPDTIWDILEDMEGDMSIKIISRFVDTNGDGTGSYEITGDYDGSPTLFKFTAQAREHVVLSRLIGSMKAVALTNADVYGTAAGSALTNGIQIYVTDVDGEILYYLTDPRLPVKTNGMWAHYCYDFTQWAGLGAGEDHGAWRWTFAKSGQPVELLPGWSLCVFVEDDFSSLVTEHHFVVQGYNIWPRVTGAYA
jgi:hypothetical protein